MKMTETYIKAKAAKVGDTVKCPACGKKFVKKTYNQVFCNNNNNTRFGNCKDRYWNKIDPCKRNNTTRISPANRTYYNLHIRERIERAEMANYDPGDSEYWDNSDNFFP